MEIITDNENKISPPHHIQHELCVTRPLYRQGRKLTAVKVYTINNESQHLIIYKVPQINLAKELKAKCAKYGDLRKFELVTQYQTDSFTQNFHVQFNRIQSARIAKRFLDNSSFYGEVLHVCYAPEYENLSETKQKLLQRQKDVVSRLVPGPTVLEYVSYEKESLSEPSRKRKYPALPITDKRLKTGEDDIWNGIPSELDPRVKSDNANIGFKKHYQIPSDTIKKIEYGPQIPDSLPLPPKETILPKNSVPRKKIIIFRKKV